MAMFAVPALLQPEVTASLLIPFNDGTATDVITPSRTITYDSNVFIRSANYCGSFKGYTSAVSGGTSSSGFTISDNSGLSTFGASNIDYTVEFWIGYAPTSTGAVIRAWSGTNTNTLFSMDSRIQSMSMQGVNFTAATVNSAMALRLKFRHIALVRNALGATVSFYSDGVLIQTVAGGNNNRPLTNIEIFQKPSNTTLYHEGYMNFFALTLGVKYTSNFNPIAVTGFDKYYIDQVTGYCT